MAKGIIYVMTTAVDGLVKIGRSGSDNFANRMYLLEKNGFSNITGLKRRFAIEVESYEEKEKLLHNIFGKSRIAGTEFFAIDVNLAVQTLSAFEGTVIYPTGESKDEIFDDATEASETFLVPDGKYTLEAKNQHTREKCSGTIVIQKGTIVLKAGAILAPLSDRASESLKAKRKAILLEGDKTISDLPCSSPSEAASIVCGHAKNGWKSWKNEKGVVIDTYRQPEKEN